MRNSLVIVCALSTVLSAQTTPRTAVHVEELDMSCKPCEDFWRYATGGWHDAHPIPADRQSWGLGTALAASTREQLRDLLEEAAADRAAQPSSDRRKMGDLYAGCMDTAAIDRRGISPLTPDLERISAIGTRIDLAATIAELQRVSSPVSTGGLGVVPGPFFLSIARDRQDPSRVIPVVGEQAGAGGAATSIFSLPGRDFYFGDDPKSHQIRAAFLEHAALLLSLAGSSPEAAAADARIILAFETDLAASAYTNVDRRNPAKTYHLMAAADVTALTPGFDWRAFLVQRGVPETTSINVTQPELLKKFGHKLTSTSIDDWKSWLRWRVIAVSAPYLSAPYANESFRFNETVLFGITEQAARWRRCVDIIDQNLGDALGKAYVDRHFQPAAKQRMNALAENVRAAMREELEASDWLEPETRKNALRKVAAVTVKVGYPERWRDYSTLTIDRATYFESVRASWQHDQRYSMAKIGKPSDNNDWTMTPPTVNAYSNASRVEVAFPAGRLQPPYFDLNAEDAANYGAIGAVIGHELGHQFDDGGSRFDHTGAVRNWWTATDRAQFDARAGCVVDQFNAIDVGGGLRHNGRQVLGEAMGDLGGVRIAYRAYRRSLAGKPEPPVLDGFTADQRFFLAYARARSNDYRPEAIRQILATDSHPLDKYRVNATLANVPEFHRAFSCKQGDPLFRPAREQCRLW